MMTDKELKKVTKALHLGSVTLRFRLRLNVDEWGMYKKGDEEEFDIRILDEQTGLVRYPIDKRWDIVSSELVNAA